MKNLLLILVLLAIVGAGGYLFMNKNTMSENVTPSVSNQSGTNLGEGLSGPSGEGMMSEEAPVLGEGSGNETDVKANVKEFTLTASEFKFDKTSLTVNRGDTVKLTLTNSGTMTHDWVLDEFNAKTQRVSPGQTDSVTFVADKAGSFEYYCSVGSHRAQGMVGKLVVQ